MTNHEFYMNLAIGNARAMKGQTDPNPLVGSVIVMTPVKVSGPI